MRYNCNLVIPVFTTSFTGTPALVAMNPRTENTANPAKILVPLLITGTSNASLLKKKTNEKWNIKDKLAKDDQNVYKQHAVY